MRVLKRLSVIEDSPSATPTEFKINDKYAKFVFSVIKKYWINSIHKTIVIDMCTFVFKNLDLLDKNKRSPVSIMGLLFLYDIYHHNKSQ